MNSAGSPVRLIRSHRRTGRITKWRQSRKNFGQFATAATELSEEQKLIKRLQKELKDAQLDRMAEATRYIPAVGIFSRGDRTGGPGKYSDS